MATPNGTKNDWIALLEAAKSSSVPKIPPGYLTRDELAKKFGKSPCTITRHLPILLESGVLTVGYFKRIDRAGRLVEMPMYKVKR